VVEVVVELIHFHPLVEPFCYGDNGMITFIELRLVKMTIITTTTVTTTMMANHLMEKKLHREGELQLEMD